MKVKVTTVYDHNDLSLTDLKTLTQKGFTVQQGYVFHPKHWRFATDDELDDADVFSLEFVSFKALTTAALNHMKEEGF